MSAADKIAAGPPGAGADEQLPKPIGGFVAPARRPAGPMGPMGPAGAVPAGIVPRDVQMEQSASIYFEGVHDRIPATFALEDMYALQRGLSAAGLLKGDFRKGIYDKKTRGAFTELLAFANQQRLEWADALNVYASSQSSEQSDVEGFLPPRFQARDPESVKQDIEAYMESRLDRILSEQEVNDMYAIVAKQERRAHESASAAQEDTFNRQMGVEVEGDLPAEVDPMAQMKSVFEERYAGAIGATESARERDARAPGLNTVGSTVSEMI